MNPVKKILVPIDFSDSTQEVVEVAVDLSRRYAAPLELFHAWEPIAYVRPEGYIVLSESEVTRITEHFKSDLAKVAETAKAAGAVGVETRVFQGYPTTAIVNHARHKDFGLIVMGTHGRTGVKHLLIGSVAENVVRTAPCPVLVVRAAARAA